MYFPYLRGKQFELIALRELCALFPQELNKILSHFLEMLCSNSSNVLSQLKSFLHNLSEGNRQKLVPIL